MYFVVAYDSVECVCVAFVLWVILCVYRLGVCVYVFSVVYNWYCLLMIVDDEWLFGYYY